MSQSVRGTAEALFTVCRDTIYAGTKGPDGEPVLVTYGPPGAYLPGAIVAVGMDIRQPITRPTAGPSRSRDAELEIDVALSVYAPGDEAVQAIVLDAAYDLAAQLETYFRTAPNETLGGACYDAHVSNVTGPAPSIAYSTPSADSPAVPIGRLADSTLTVTASIRY